MYTQIIGLDNFETISIYPRQYTQSFDSRRGSFFPRLKGNKRATTGPLSSRERVLATILLLAESRKRASHARFLFLSLYPPPSSSMARFVAPMPNSIRLTRCAITINVMAFHEPRLVSSCHLLLHSFPLFFSFLLFPPLFFPPCQALLP